jgi:hypothetical protein
MEMEKIEEDVLDLELKVKMIRDGWSSLIPDDWAIIWEFEHNENGNLDERILCAKLLYENLENKIRHFTKQVTIHKNMWMSLVSIKEDNKEMARVEDMVTGLDETMQEKLIKAVQLMIDKKKGNI